MGYDFHSLAKQADEATNRERFYTDFEDVDPNVLHQISELTDWIRTKGKGSDVREVIAQLFERTWLEGMKQGNANMEVAEARGTAKTLASRLNQEKEALERIVEQATRDFYSQLSSIPISKLNKNDGLIDETYLTQKLRDQIAGKAGVSTSVADKSVTTAKLANGAVNGQVVVL